MRPLNYFHQVRKSGRFVNFSEMFALAIKYQFERLDDI